MSRKIEFKCPKCDGTAVEEIMVDVTVSTEVDSITQYGDGSVDLFYGEQTNEGGCVERYQCGDCGYLIVDNQPDEDDLASAIMAINPSQDITSFDFESLISQFGSKLRGWTGEDLARLWNEHSESQVVYEGDDIFRVKNESKKDE